METTETILTRPIRLINPDYEVAKEGFQPDYIEMRAGETVKMHTEKREDCQYRTLFKILKVGMDFRFYALTIKIQNGRARACLKATEQAVQRIRNSGVEI